MADAEAFYGDFNPSHDFYAFNGYGNLVSFDKWDNIEKAYCDIDSIADWIIENDREDLVEEYDLQEIDEDEDEDED